MVMRSCRAFPLVGIVEFIMYGCMKYFRMRYMAASINISNPQIQFCTRVTQYMQQKIENAKLHRVISTGTMEHRFEVPVYDIAVEAYCPWRVRRQFGQRQEFPVPTALEHVSRQDHR